MGNQKQTGIDNKLDELGKLPSEMECKIRSIAKDPDKFKGYKKDLFEKYQNLINDYEKLRSKELMIINEDIPHIVLLNCATEGLIKIVLFDQDPYGYLNIEKKERTFGKLKGIIIDKIKEKEKNKNKIESAKKILELINNLRNNFMHFPFYSQFDYRFYKVYFNFMAYIIEIFGHWNEIDEKVAKYIKEKALEKINGIDLLERDALYEEKTNQI